MTYRITVWRCRYVEAGAFPDFRSALAAFAVISDTSKQLVNVDLADSGSSGLTDQESDAVYSLPATRAATPQELAAALSMLEAA